MVLGCGQIESRIVTIQQYAQSTRIVHFQVEILSRITISRAGVCGADITDSCAISCNISKYTAPLQMT